MGKFKGSDIHEIYSNWHYSLIDKHPKYRALICSDLDRIWVEYDLKGNLVVCIIDLKWEEGPDFITPTEQALKEWFNDKGARYYTVYIKRDWSRFRVVNERGEGKIMEPLKFADWLVTKRKK